MPLRRVTPTLVLLGALAATAAPPARAAAPSLASLMARIASPWPERQRPDGTFPDAVIARTGPAGRDPYGTAMLGYGLLAAGVREHRRAWEGAGLRALGRAATHPTDRLSIFEGLALASGYSLAQRALPTDPRFAAVRPGWAARLKAIRLVQIGFHPYSNWDLVEGIELLELARTGLRPDAALLRATARHVMTSSAPAAQREGGLLSDPPWEPLAYHAFTTALLARAIQIDGVGDRATLARAAGATRALMSPAGDVAYLGRSDEEAWTLSMTAFIARSTGRSTVAARVLGRLAGRYFGPRGLRITPSGAVPALDTYAAQASYTGLALVGLDWAAGARRLVPVPKRRRVPSTVLGGENGRFAVVRTKRLWFVIKEQPARVAQERTKYVEDNRFDAGLAALELHTARGWRELLPARPRTTTARAAAALTVQRGARRGRLAGTRIALAAHGTGVTLAGRWLAPDGSSLGPVAVRYRAIRCGVAMTIGVRRGDRLRLVVLARPGAPAPARLPHARVQRGAPVATSTVARAIPFRFLLTARRRGSVRATVCPRP